MNDEMIERCSTGIEGFDNMTKGGFVRDSSNVVVGGPGSGKTTFLLEFLYKGVMQYNENGLYCSFEPDIVDTLNDAYVHGWDFFKLAEEGRIKFIRFSPETSIDELKGELTKLISQNDIKRICFDPVSILALNVSDQGKIREKVFDLVSLMKRLKVTTILADETIDSEGAGEVREGEWTKTDIIRFLCDSVTILYSTGLTGDSDRAIKIEKMRRTNHERRIIGMKIKERGIDIFAKPITKNMQSQNQQVQESQMQQSPQNQEDQMQQPYQNQEMQTQQDFQNQGTQMQQPSQNQEANIDYQNIVN